MIAPVESLSEKEKEVLRLLLQGHDAKSTARDLGASVHSVNERLRSARRKLGLSSSREAARLLGEAEQDTHKFLGDKPFGLSAAALAPDKQAGRGGSFTSQRPLVLVFGGVLLMSLIIAAVALTWAVSQNSSAEGPPRWGQVRAASELRSEVRNAVRLDGTSLTWNGAPITEDQLRQYLDITTQMSPQPVLVFSYSPETKSARVETVRSVIEGVLQCTPRNCREVVPAPAR
ncbi:DNA-binding CsgD family transcriptional regulator [Sphingomonas kaistensis]|uniref:DNA-binding CsgD family transcriptional regulator n=1 Tax=Sphingomonas kaistensis TaxID=298708 RepID=A0A7X5Y6V7_9SPHN|nr:helix-turn-helix transcriptional regulator [Sphingomonas kaistensis]NJC05672.1 DNA-binding CsgD family transcriptional regulator [Sphingomonas kaistensis]